MNECVVSGGKCSAIQRAWLLLFTYKLAHKSTDMAWGTVTHLLQLLMETNHRHFIGQRRWHCCDPVTRLGVDGLLIINLILVQYEGRRDVRGDLVGVEWGECDREKGSWSRIGIGSITSV